MMELLLSWDGLRAVNAILAVVVVTLLTAGTVTRWKVMPKRIQHIAPWVILTYCIIAYGSVEVARAEGTVAPGVRVTLTTLNLCGLIIALLYGISDREYEFEYDESAGAPRR